MLGSDGVNESNVFAYLAGMEKVSSLVPSSASLLVH